MTDLYALRDMLDKATGPSLELDAAICEVFSLYPAGTERVMNTDGASTAWAGNAIWWEALPLTSSIDAALALVERLLPGAGWHLMTADTQDIAQPFECWFDYPLMTREGASTPPLAILKATVAALIAMEEAEHG